MYHNHHFQDDFIEIVENTNNAYVGKLQHYFGLALRAPNIYMPYHNLGHVLSVTRVCYRACRHYVGLGQMNRRQARNLLIAALLHDYGHPGFLRDDFLNIETAINALRRNILSEDVPDLAEIVMIIKATQHEHIDYGEDISLAQSIIRDADICQTFGEDWMHDILVGLGKEWGKSPYEMLELQIPFLRKIRFYSSFGRQYYGGEEAIVTKIKEVKGLIRSLE